MIAELTYRVLRDLNLPQTEAGYDRIEPPVCRSTSILSTLVRHVQSRLCIECFSDENLRIWAIGLIPALPVASTPAVVVALEAVLEEARQCPTAVVPAIPSTTTPLPVLTSAPIGTVEAVGVETETEIETRALRVPE